MEMGFTVSIMFSWYNNVKFPSHMAEELIGLKRLVSASISILHHEPQNELITNQHEAAIRPPP
jgi:hypothetical protein